MHRNFITNRENTAIVRKFYKISAEKFRFYPYLAKFLGLKLKTQDIL